MSSVKAVPITVALSRRTRRDGFTLIEMLVVVTIIIGMASMLMVGMSHVREEARAAATRATIAKINQILMQKWEAYETRRVPVDMSGLQPREAAAVRLQAIRYLQQFEMPDRTADFSPIQGSPNSIPLPHSKSMPYPALALLYQARQIARPINTNTTTKTSQGAMLYMVCTAGNPEAREMFNANEIGDFDKDGWPEFLDGWGHPIYYLRWATGYSPYSKTDPSVTSYSDIQSGNPEADPDPFDPQKLSFSMQEGNYAGFHLIPLIYSAGPDMKIGSDGIMRGYGINAGDASAQLGGRMPPNPFDNAYHDVGKPASEEPGAIYDNITNHRIEH